jgi:hypothetical protein
MSNKDIMADYHPSPVQHFNKHLYETNDDFKKPSYNTIEKYNSKSDDSPEDSFENRIKNIPKSTKNKLPSAKSQKPNGVLNIRSPSAKNTINTKPQKLTITKKEGI